MTTDHNPTDRPDHVAYRLETSQHFAEWLSGELAHRAQLDHDGTTEPEPAATKGAGAVRIFGRLTSQLARVCELVNLTLSQIVLNNDLGMAWILLEQARQQLGHAAASAAAIGAQRQLTDDELESEAGALAQLVWFLQRDRMPWPDDASVVVDFGSGLDAAPDFRPDTALELVPLQLLANATMTFSAGDAVQVVGDTVMMMAFGEYVGTIMAEAMELLEYCADQSNEPNLLSLVETGHQVADLVAGAFPPAWQVFHGPAGFPDGTT